MLHSVAYDEVIGLFVSHSREPKWAGPDGRALTLMKADAGKLGFLKGAPDWLTVRTKRVFIPLRVRDEDLSRITTELESRTGTKIVRPK